ncbi:toll/interleukin-1 receptor domain-containing protein [Draconibacterium sp. IB214405]|uniref:toll/interleukin-1 receptor domain-containing protein n=1 Tax=Draconibacterium sp. IB214405 TaxID=3097352 RepID=UPI002A18479F|nr:toll/interleukin-1 receptor domain-containing protein [Draconibacterium sp. IB214405]MDX8338833.1 toll/interleukin-1 receptor domain-containing protein [Draconibacterium sp. IB214405]
MEDEKAKYKIFISHCSKDKEYVVKPVADLLISDNISCFYDDYEIKSFDNILDKIDYGLRNSQYVVAFIHEDYFDRNYTTNEFKSFLHNLGAKKGRILPILLGTKLKKVFNDLSFANLVKPYIIDDYERGIPVKSAEINDLVNQIKNLLNELNVKE